MYIGQTVFVVKFTPGLHAAQKALIIRKIHAVTTENAWKHAMACYVFCPSKYEVLYEDHTREIVPAYRLEPF